MLKPVVESRLFCTWGKKLLLLPPHKYKITKKVYFDTFGNIHTQLPVKCKYISLLKKATVATVSENFAALISFLESETIKIKIAKFTIIIEKCLGNKQR